MRELASATAFCAAVACQSAAPAPEPASVSAEPAGPATPPAPPVDEPTAYGDYSMLSRQEFDFSLDVYNTDGYILHNEALPGNTWYEWWYVFDHDTRTFETLVVSDQA